MFKRSYFDKDRVLPSLDFSSEVSKTEQHHKKQCDITHLINRLVGGDTSVLKTDGVYADVSEMPEGLQAVCNKSLDCRRAYEALPEAVQARYKTAEEFFRAANDPNSRASFEELGLLVKPEPKKEPIEVKVVSGEKPETVNG